MIFNNNMSSRQLKTAAVVREALVDIFRRGRMLDRHLIDANLTITHVKMSPDLKVATCYVVPFVAGVMANDNIEYTKTRDDLLDALNTSKHAIRRMIAGTINMKFAPELRFFYDDTFDMLAKVDQINFN